jgi:hypothetical protein
MFVTCLLDVRYRAHKMPSFVDRDMLMRFCGFGIGHKATHFATRKLEEEVRQAFELDGAVLEGDDSDWEDDDDEANVMVPEAEDEEDSDGSEEEEDDRSEGEEDNDEENDSECEDEHALGYAVVQ